MASGTARFVDAYTLDALTILPPQPIIALRAPTTADTGYPLCTLWDYKTANQVYVLSSVVNASATWLLLESGGSGGVFTTLTSTSTTTLATTVAGTTNTFGNTGTGTSLGLLVGTGNFTLDGVGASTYTIGASTTTGTVAIGGTAQTGAITLGSSSGTNIVNVGTGEGATTVNIATGATNPKVVHIADGAVANAVTIGSTSSTASTAIRSGSGGIGLTGAVTSANAITVTSGNVTLSNGQLVLSTATTGITLPGPVRIISGSGTPAGGLAVNIGDLYINTAGSTTTDRLFIATAPGAWTFFTSNA